MNKKVLLKCLTELEKPEPNISYVRGMLETALEMIDEATPTRPTIVNPTYPQSINTPMRPNVDAVLDINLNKDIPPTKIVEMERMIQQS